VTRMDLQSRQEGQPTGVSREWGILRKAGSIQSLRAKPPRIRLRTYKQVNQVGRSTFEFWSLRAGLKSGAPGEIRTPDLLLRRQSEQHGPTKNQAFVVASAGVVRRYRPQLHTFCTQRLRIGASRNCDRRHCAVFGHSSFSARSWGVLEDFYPKIPGYTLRHEQ
jgi:hypothetical protein